MPKSKPARRPKPVQITARLADKHVLYRHSVQNPEHEVEFLDRVFRKLRGRRPRSLREDFCGTAWIAAEWVKSHPERVATGLDLDRPTLEWARRHVVNGLAPAARARLSLVRADVLTPPKSVGRHEIVIAYNFSYWIFTQREVLRRYFETVRRGLTRDGVFVLDLMGGAECHEEVTDRTRCWMPRDRATGVGGPYTYVWEHAMFDPITARTTCRIHFEFPKGPALRNAFVYHWRVWELMELRDLLREAGFAKTRVYWEGENAQGGGNGVFRERTKGTADRAFVAYLLAEG